MDVFSVITSVALLGPLAGALVGKHKRGILCFIYLFGFCLFVFILGAVYLSYLIHPCKMSWPIHSKRDVQDAVDQLTWVCEAHMGL